VAVLAMLSAAKRRRLADHGKPLLASNVRGIIHCMECRRPRCIFSINKPLASDALAAFMATAANYTCGTALSVDGFVVRENLDCTAPVETVYYLCSRVRGGMQFEHVCVWCAKDPVQSPHVDKADLDVREGKEPLPLCKLCHERGLMPLVVKDCVASMDVMDDASDDSWDAPTDGAASTCMHTMQRSGA